MTLFSRLLPLVLTAGLLAPGLAPAASVPAGSTLLVDRPSGTGPLPFDGTNDATLETHSLSADGRFVVFTSGSDTLLGGDEDSATNVYRLDRSTGNVVQADTTAAGGQPLPQSTSNTATISADGRYVAFASANSGLIPGAPVSGVYVKDLQTGALTLASRATGPDGAPAAQAFRPVISGDGRHVVFLAGVPLHADNADGVQNKIDAYVRALDAGTTHMVSVGANGAEAGGVISFANPDIDFAGDAAAFVTSASLDPADTVADNDAYVRTGLGGGAEHTALVSAGTGSSGQAGQVALSGDGRLAAWDNSFGSIYMSTLSGGTVGAPVRMNVIRPGGKGDAASTPVFEPVANATAAPARLTFFGFSALDPNDTNGVADLYAAEVAHPGDGQFVHLETSGTAKKGISAGAAAANGSVVVFASADPDLPAGDGIRRQVYLQTPGTPTLLSLPAGAARASDAGRSFIDARHSVSDDGHRVVFDASAPAFGSPVNLNITQDFIGEVLVRDVVANRTILASAAPDGTPADGPAGRPSIDAAGDRVAFTSGATNLVPGVKGTHAYVRDLGTGTTTLVDRTAGGAPLMLGAGEVKISADGRHVVYSSSSPDAPGAPANDQNSHLYVVDLGTGSTVLADRSSQGAVADKSSFRADISGDGSRVAFVSAATNLGAGDPGNKRQVYVRDLSAGTTTWASVPEDGNPQHANADQPSLSRSGDIVAFQQLDPAFEHGMTGHSQVFVRDLTPGTTELASRDDAGAVLGTDASDPSLSADGRQLALAAGTFSPTGAGTEQVYLRDRTARTTTVVSVARDGTTPARLSAAGGSLSGPGDCVAFASTSTDLVTPSYGPDYVHVFLHALTPRCPAALPAHGRGSPPPPPPPHDTTPPRIRGAHLTAKRFAPGARGIAFVFSLSEKASTTITLTRRADGRRRGTRCVVPRRGLKRHCIRTLRAGMIRATRTRAGANRVSFAGRVGKRSLTPGNYRAQLVARDPAGNRSRAVTVAFTIVKRR